MIAALESGRQTPSLVSAGDAELLASARALAAGFRATAAELDASGAFPRANVDALYQSGLTNLTVSRARGGFGASLATTRRVVSAIAEGEPSTALILSMHLVNHSSIRMGQRWPERISDALIASSLAGPALVNSLQVEPEAGSPSYGALPRTTARRDGGRWRLSGRKRYATGCEGLHWFVVSAVTDELQPRVGSFVVARDAGGIKIVRTWDTAGMRATGSHDVVFDDVAVPLDFTLDLQPVEAGMRRDEAAGVWFMLLIGAVYHGIARAIRDEVVDFAATTVPGALGASLATVPRIKDEIGAIEVILESSERLLDSVAEEFDRGGRPAQAAGMIRHAVIENAVRVSELALAIAGNAGVSRGKAFERHHRNVLCGRTHAPNGYVVRASAAEAALLRRRA